MYFEIEYFLMTFYYRFLIILSLITFLDYFTRAVMTDIVLLHMLIGYLQVWHIFTQCNLH